MKHHPSLVARGASSRGVLRSPKLLRNRVVVCFTSMAEVGIATWTKGCSRKGATLRSAPCMTELVLVARTVSAQPPSSWPMRCHRFGRGRFGPTAQLVVNRLPTERRAASFRIASWLTRCHRFGGVRFGPTAQLVVNRLPMVREEGCIISNSLLGKLVLAFKPSGAPLHTNSPPIISSPIILSFHEFDFTINNFSSYNQLIKNLN